VARTRQRAKRGPRAFVDLWTGCFAKHNLLTWASAIAFQALVALVGIQADELIRKDATAGEKGMFKRVRAALG